MANTGCSGHVATTVSLPPIPDIRSRMSGIDLLTSGLPPRSERGRWPWLTGTFDPNQKSSRKEIFEIPLCRKGSGSQKKPRTRRPGAQVFSDRETEIEPQLTFPR